MADEQKIETLDEVVGVGSRFTFAWPAPANLDDKALQANVGRVVPLSAPMGGGRVRLIKLERDPERSGVVVTAERVE